MHSSIDSVSPALISRHAMGDGIERLRPRQRDDASPTQIFEADLVAAAKIHRQRIPPRAAGLKC
ncbi:hypothetical protein ABID19_005266 [Mesorhizobium robiniae]|uniref:Uncharacterized protein n=1 Tax=Mesorhizobium robiniae TaxID=559315 RepID=A0ABV2GVA9_9HYPH